MKRKRWLIPISVLAGVLLLVALLVLNVGVHFNPTDNSDCISVVFDKLPMLLANRAVLVKGNERYDISDADLVDDIVQETMVATHSGLRHTKRERWIEIYWGDILVRKIQWVGGLDEMFIVYQPDLIHWVIPMAEGIVFPSDELIARLNALMKAD